ncbi:MAG: class II fructose-bisphosphate aldolase [Chloroflexota bacterium]|jgi:fructose-bisphosphate aldolase class II|nr:class II fructose-bisphosphate aldolase [Chloroflexota bacterium]
MIIPSGPLLTAAREAGYAVGSFNVASIDGMQAVIRAAEAEQAPVLAMIWSGVQAWMDFDALALAVVSLAERAAVPVAVHLDHGEDLEIVERALGQGFSSVMFDGARHPLEENIRLTVRAGELAHAHEATLEAEIGEIGGEREDPTGLPDLSDRDEAVRFWKESRPDVLAVAIGSQHGRYQNEPWLDIPRLASIAQQVLIPLSLHGGSYTPADQIRQAVANGIAKINIASELEEAFLAGASQVDLAKARYATDLTGVAHSAIEERVREKIRLFGSSNKAQIASERMTER